MKADLDPKSGLAGRPIDRLGNAGLPAGVAIVRSRLFIKYVALLIGLVVFALLANSAFEVWFSYQEQKASLVSLEREQAQGAADKIGRIRYPNPKPARLDHTAALVDGYTGTAPLRCASAVAPGPRHYRACSSRCIGT